MFANTLTLKLNTVDYILNRVNQDNYGSEYTFMDSAQMLSLKIRHNAESQLQDSNKMSRHNILLEHIVYATATTPQYTRTASVTMRGPTFSDPQLLANVANCLQAFASVPANSLALAQGVN